MSFTKFEFERAFKGSGGSLNRAMLLLPAEKRTAANCENMRVCLRAYHPTYQPVRDDFFDGSPGEIIRYTATEGPPVAVLAYTPPEAEIFERACRYCAGATRFPVLMTGPLKCGHCGAAL